MMPGSAASPFLPGLVPGLGQIKACAHRDDESGPFFSAVDGHRLNGKTVGGCKKAEL